MYIKYSLSTAIEKVEVTEFDTQALIRTPYKLVRAKQVLGVGAGIGWRHNFSALVRPGIDAEGTSFATGLLDVVCKGRSEFVLVCNKKKVRKFKQMPWPSFKERSSEGYGWTNN